MRRSDFIFRYRARNRPVYNKALSSRGSLTLWVDEQAVSAWRREGAPRGRGRPQIYTDTAIECALVVRAVFYLSLRATQGFLESVFRLDGRGPSTSAGVLDRVSSPEGSRPSFDKALVG